MGLIMYMGSVSLVTSALHRWSAKALKSTHGYKPLLPWYSSLKSRKTQLPWYSDCGTDLLAVALHRELPDCISLLVNLLPRERVISLFGGHYFEYRCYAHLAAATGNVDVLRLLKTQGFCLHQEDIRGRTPICIAIRCNNLDAVQYLLSTEKPVRGIENNALTFASSFGSMPAVWLIAHYLLDRCQTLNEKVNVQKVVLMGLLRRLDLSTSEEDVIHLLEQLPANDLVSMGPEYIVTAILHGASVTLLQNIIDKGADVNVLSDSRMETPLQTAIGRGDREIIRLLLESGAKCTPQILCLDSLSTEILDLLFTHYVYRARDLYHCVSIGNAAIVRRLLGFGKNPNPSTRQGNALQVAVVRGSLDIAQMLLEAGANPDHFVHSPATRWGTPLYIATINANIPMMRLLLQHGADMTNCLGPHSESVLHVAVNRGNVPAMRVLVDHDDGYRGNPWTKTTTLTSRDKLEMLRLVLRDHLSQLPPDASELA